MNKIVFENSNIKNSFHGLVFAKMMYTVIQKFKVFKIQSIKSYKFTVY